VGSVVLRASALPLDILPDGVLVRETDEDGVHRVFLRGLLR
jgi:hypothetical protein